MHVNCIVWTWISARTNEKKKKTNSFDTPANILKSKGINIHLKFLYKLTICSNRWRKTFSHHAQSYALRKRLVTEKKRRNIITKMYRYYSDRWGKATKKKQQQQISERKKKRNLYLRKSLLQNVKRFAVTILPLSNEWNFVGYIMYFFFYFSTDNNLVIDFLFINWLQICSY